MSVIRSLNVLLQAKTENFVKGLNEAESRTKQFSGRLKTIGIAVGGFIALDKAMDAVASSARALAVEVGQAYSQIFELDRAASRLGVTTGTAQVLKLAGDTLGSDLNDVADIVAEVSIKLGDALNGSQDLADAFGSIGLDPKLTSQIESSVDRAILVLDRLEAIKDSNERIFRSDQILGGDAARQAVGLARALRAARDEVERLGLGIDDLDARRVSELVSEFNAIRIQTDLFFKKLAVELAPAFQTLLDSANQLLDNMNDIGDSVESFGFKLNAVVSIMTEMNVELERTQGILGLLNGARGTGIGFLNSVFNPLTQLQTSLEGLSDYIGVDALAESFDRVRQAEERREKLLQQLRNDRDSDPAKRIADEIRKAINDPAVERGSQDAFASRYSVFIEATKKPIEEVRDLAKEELDVMKRIEEKLVKPGPVIRINEHRFN